MNILMVSVEIPSPLAGGIGTSICNLYQYLKDKTNITLLISSRYAEKNTETFYRKSVIIPSVGRGLLEIMTFGKGAAKYINKHCNEYDVIHLHLPIALGILQHLENRILKKTLVTFHTTYAGYKEMFKYVKWNEIRTIDDIAGKICYYSVMSKLESKLVKKIEHSSAVSTGIADEISMFYGLDEIGVVPNGILLNNNLLKKRNTHNIHTGQILFVGRLVIQKGILDLLKAVDLLRNTEHSFKLNICGCGYLGNIIRKYIIKKRLGEYIILHGYVSKDYLVRLYESSQIAVMPSLYEGLPMVGLELASVGMPIVATEMARIRDIICDENASLLTPSREFRRLAENVAYLLENLGQSISIGRKNAKKCCCQCDIKKVAQAYLKRYSEIV